jgi:hypothetical protein
VCPLRSVLLLGLLASPVLAQSDSSSTIPLGPGVDRREGLAPGSTALSGEDFQNPIVVPSLPFNGSGNTCNYSGSVNAPCSHGGPDQVYAFTPTRDLNLSILASAGLYYYAVIGVYENSTANYRCFVFPSGPSGTPVTYFVRAGNTYYIVGEVTSPLGEPSCGGYGVQLEEAPQSCTTCPAGAIPEGEVNCFDGYVDMTDAGCNSYVSPIPFKNIECGPEPVSICGSYGDFLEPTPDVFHTLDYDWYRVVLSHPSRIQATITGDEATILRVLRATDPSNPCLDSEVCPPDTTYPCSPATRAAQVPAGTYLISISKFSYRTFGCGWKYTLTVSCSDAITPSRKLTWGSLKARYR